MHNGSVIIPVYDDGFGPLWIHRDSMGISGIVRAQTFENAYSICEDEFFPEATETVDELVQEYGFRRERVKIIRDDSGSVRGATPSDPYPAHHDSPDYRGVSFVRWETRETPDPDAWTENELFQEAFGFRPNGHNAKDTLKHGIYAKDLNGDTLDMMTQETIDGLGITLNIETEE